MAPYAFLACILLFTGTKALSVIEHKGYFHELPTDDGTSRSVWFPLEGSSDSKIFFLVHLKCDFNLWPNSICHVHVFTYDEKNGTMKNCSLSMSTAQSSYSKDLVQVISLGNHKIVFGFNYFKDMKDETNYHLRSKVYMLDTNGCEKHEVSTFDGAVRIGESKTKGFDLVVIKDPDSEDGCGKENQCTTLSFESRSKSMGTPKPFIAEIAESIGVRLSVEHLNDNEILIKGYKNYTFKVVRVDRSTGKSSEVMQVFNDVWPDLYGDKLMYVNHKLTFCWAKYQGKSVHCVRYDNNNDLDFARTLTFDEAVEPVGVYVTVEGDLFLVTVNKDCKKGSICAVYNGTKVRANGRQVKSVQLPFLCSGEVRIYEFMYEAFESTIGFQYACKYRNGYSHNRFLVDFVDEEKVGTEHLDGCVQRGNGWDCL